MLETLNSSLDISIVNLTEAGDDLDMMSAWVKKANNKLQVLVHPYFDYELRFLRGEDYQDYFDRQQRFIKACVANSVPLIIFHEGGSQYPVLEENIPDTRGKVFVVETLPLQIEPEDERGLGYVFSLFKEAGVDHIVVGGSYLTVDSDKNLTGCVGKFVNKA